MKCPVCKVNNLHPVEVRNALSRKDNKTYICGDCGLAESIEEFLKFQDEIVTYASYSAKGKSLIKESEEK